MKLGNYEMTQVRTGIWRGARPASADIKAIAEQGVKYILNLEDPQPGEQAEAERLGIRFVSYPWGEILPPTFEQLRVAGYDCRNFAAQGMLIHCTHGVDRTGAAVFADRVENSRWTFEKAYQEMLDVGHHVFFYWWWRARLRDYWRSVQ